MLFIGGIRKRWFGSESQRKRHAGNLSEKNRGVFNTDPKLYQ